MLPDFRFDSGLQPAGSPVQLGLAFTVGGSLTADARGIVGGDGDEMVVAAVPGSGSFGLEAHVKLDGSLKIDVASFAYDGPIPGIENVDVAFGATTAFEPFLAGASARVEALLPEIPLPPIPLPGGIPGRLELLVSAGSVLRSELAGTCAGIEPDGPKFLASPTTSGSIVMPRPS